MQLPHRASPYTADDHPTHPNALPDWAVRKMTKRRGSPHAFNHIKPAKTALIVIDVMADLLINTPTVGSIIDPINRLASALRDQGGTVVWVYPAPITEPDPNQLALWGDAHHQAVADVCNAGSDFATGLMPDKDHDLIIQKSGYSAFFPGHSELPELLTDNSIDTVIITGALTNICCESSARDAAARDFRVIQIADANAARTDEEHLMALYNVYRNFGDVRMTDEFLEVLSAASG